MLQEDIKHMQYMKSIHFALNAVPDNFPSFSVVDKDTIVSLVKDKKASIY